MKKNLMTVLILALLVAEIIKENIEYDLLVLRYGRERLDEALELMLEVILSKRPYTVSYTHLRLT